MVYKIDYVDEDVLRWSVTETGVECEVDESYTPTIYVSVHSNGDFSTARAALRDHPAVTRVAIVEECVSFRHDPEQVDAKQSRERVLLASEVLSEYDSGFYRELLIRAAASVLSPLGWREKRIKQELGQYTESCLASFR